MCGCSFSPFVQPLHAGDQSFVGLIWSDEGPATPFTDVALLFKAKTLLLEKQVPGLVHRFFERSAPKGKLADSLLPE
jgi:hypothetical protein